MSDAASNHPITDTLRALSLGQLAETELVRVCAHLENCPECCWRIEQVATEDPLLARLQDTAAHREKALITPAQCRSGFRALRNGSVEHTAASCKASEPPPVILRAPKQVGEYEILGEVGRGGMGVVYKARHRVLNRFVALKMVLAGDFASESQILRIRLEAELAARVQHPNIVQIHEIGSYEGRPFLALEWIDGGSVADRLDGTPWTPTEAARLIEILARAIHVAHEQGVVHRDLKPANVLTATSRQQSAISVAPDGEASLRTLKADGYLLKAVPKITDFGLAQPIEGGQTLTQSGFLVGTPGYMAPEQASGKRALVGPATDIYALGVMLYQLSTGQMPFHGDSSLEVLRAVREDEAVRPRRLQPHIPRDLESITLRCLEKEPAQRYPSALALAEDLWCFQQGQPIRARPVAGPARLLRWCRRKPLIATLLLLLAGSLAGGFGGVTWKWLEANEQRNLANNEKQAALREAYRAKWYTYRANVAAAANALQLGNIGSARRYLEAAPEQFRNWEWRHFSSQLDRPQSVLNANDAQVSSVAFSPDGKRLASPARDGSVCLWDVATGRSVAGLRGHSGPVTQVMYSRNGKYLASSSEDRTVCLWDMMPNQSGGILHSRFRSAGCLAFSPDSQLLAARTPDSTVALWDVATGAQLRVLRQQNSDIVAVAFSPNGKQLVGGGENGKLYQWETSTGDVRAIWQGHGAGVRAVAFSPDGTRIVSSGDYPDHTVRLWEVATGRSIAMKGHKNRVTYVAFSPDGTRILSASLDQTARLWRAADGQLLRTLQGHRGHVLAAAFDPSGKHVVTASRDQTLHLWDAQTGELITVLGGHQGAVWSVAFSPDGSRLASGSADHTVRLWDVRLAEQNGVLRGHTSYVYGVAFRPDGNQVASAAWDGTVRLWDPTTGQQTGRLDHERQIVTSVAFAPDGRQMVTGLGNNTISLWDLAARKLRYTWQVPASPVSNTRAVFDPEGRFVASGAGAGSAYLWDVASGRAVAVLGAQGSGSWDVAFSPDGGQLASAERDGTVRLWGVPTGQPKGVLHGHTDQVLAVCYSSDGSLLASAGEDSTVRLWDTKTQAPLAVLPHAGPVYSVAFTPDGTRLAAACRDSTIRLWDVGTREEVAELRGHSDYVHAVAFSPDGSRLVSGSGDYTVRIWDTLPPQRRATPRPTD